MRPWGSLAGLVLGVLIVGHANEVRAEPQRPDRNSCCQLAKPSSLQDTANIGGIVHVETVPSDATVVVDELRAEGNTPVDLTLRPGRHSLHIFADGYLSEYQEVDVTDGSHQELHMELVQPASAPGEMDICQIDPSAPGCGTAQINMAEEAKKAIKNREIYDGIPRLGTAPAKAMGVAALATAATATVFGLLALRDRSDSGNPLSARAQEGQTFTALADAGFGLAVGFVVMGVVLYLQRDQPEPLQGGPRATWGSARPLLNF
jgi:hypothetical protein